MPEQPITQATEFDPEDEYRPEPEPEPQSPSWMNGSTRIGIHTSIAGSYVNALEAARKLGCNALQIFSASPRMWQGGSARIPEVDAQAFRARREELRLGPPDRESTRLDSSHQLISYALFCFEKK